MYHFVKFLMEPSGGSDSFHTFVHSSVTSNEVQQQLLRLYKPVATSFIGRYGSVWFQGFSREANENASAHVLSRWASASLALQLVRAAEDARGVPYEFIYLTRPDVVLWVGVDLRHYCKDAVYYSNCYPPFFPGRNKGCPWRVGSPSSRSVESSSPVSVSEPGQWVHSEASSRCIPCR